MSDFRRMFPKVETILLGAIFGGVFPILCFLIGWWGSIPFVTGSAIKYYALGGLLVGIVIDILFLGRWLVNAYRLNLVWMGVIYLFYSVGLYGFLMGFPVFNFLMGLFAGYYMGLRTQEEQRTPAEAEQIFKRTGFFASSVLAIACVASIWLATTDATTAANISGMFALKQPLSQSNVLLLSAVGGMVLVVLEYFITRAMARRAYR